MSSPTFKIVNLRWWNLPIPLMSMKDEGMVQVGWVWRTRAYVVKNQYHGWIAVLEEQTKENLDVWFCPHCGNSLSIRANKFKEFFERKEKEAQHEQQKHNPNAGDNSRVRGHSTTTQ